MKIQIIGYFFFLSLLTTPLFSQITIDGQVSIDIQIPIPKDIVIISRTPDEKPKSFPEKRKKNTCHGNCDHNASFSYGEIQNQNGPVGRQIYTVVDAQLKTLNNGVEVVNYTFNSGDILELFMTTINTNDYNYHSYPDTCSCDTNNKIIKVLFNGQYLDLKDGSLSLQPSNHSNFHSVVNLHSQYEGDFNGSVNF